MANNRFSAKDVAAVWQARTIPLVDREHRYRHRPLQLDFVRELLCQMSKGYSNSKKR
jgi:hypothetical protein